ncbi:MAG: class I SAM-dependent methyltransferase, partial [Thermoleophilaceae bacterium]
MTDLEHVPRAREGVEGWLTDPQARRLSDRARALQFPARIVEIGSYRGRSTIALASSAPDGVTVVAIDPHAGDDRGPRQIHGDPAEGEADHRAFVENLERAGVAERVEHVRLPSKQALARLPGAAHLVYVDGAHRYWPARQDLTGWGERLAPGGALLVHDAWSSVGVTLALLRTLVFGSRFRYAGRTGSLAEYERHAVRGRARAANALR